MNLTLRLRITFACVLALAAGALLLAAGLAAGGLRTWIVIGGVIAITTGSVAAWGITRAVMAPLRHAITAAKRIAAGDLTGNYTVARNDEYGIHNIIFWPAVFAANRYILLKASIAIIAGKVQNQDNVINVIAERVEDYSHYVGDLKRHSRDFR